MLDSILWLKPLSDLMTLVNLQLLLLAGSGILAVSLLVLALTHWGHSRPIWKCVLLSFVAHLLLLGYAYGTRLIWDTSPRVSETAPEDFEELKVSVIEEEIRDPVDESFDLDLPQDGTAPAMDLQALSPLARPKIDSDIVFEPIEIPAAEPPVVTNQPPPRAPTSDLPETRSLDLSSEPSPEEMLALLPEGKIVDPEPLELNAPRESKSTVDGPRMEFDGDLPRPSMDDITQPEAMTASQRQANRQPIPAQLRPSMTLQTAPLPDRQSSPSTSLMPQLEPLRQSLPPGKLKLLSRSRRVGDGQPIPQAYSLRQPGNRLAIAQRRGGSIETEEAVEAALRWLAENQQADGRWDPRQTEAGREDRVYGHNRNGAGAKADAGISGLATLAFLAAGHTHLEGEYQKVVGKAIQYLASQQKSNGDLSGDAKLFARMYCHSMALLALSEALAMTGDRELLEAVQRGVAYSEKAQNPTDGGWRYQPGDSGDMSQFGWQVLALHSAQLGGVKLHRNTVPNMKQFLQLCSSGVGGGLASYRPNQLPSTTMTAEALLCRFFLQESVQPMTVMEAQRRIVKECPNSQHINLYYWYYGTLAMYHAGGESWHEWNEAMKSTLLELQVRDGEQSGSWEPNGMWGGYGGRVYSTAMATLNLEVYYRYLPLYQELAGAPVERR